MENGQGEVNNDAQRHPIAAEETVVLPPVGVASSAANLKTDAPGPVVRAEEASALHVPTAVPGVSVSGVAVSDAGSVASATPAAASATTTTPVASAASAVSTHTRSALSFDSPLTAVDDIVDTQWGIPPLEFPSSVYGDDQPGDSGATTALPPVIMPETGASNDAVPAPSDIRSDIAADLAAEPEAQPKKKRSPWLIVAIVAVVVIVIALAVGGFVYWNSLKNDSAHSQALAACNTSNTAANDASEKLSQALDGSKKAQAVTSSQVADTSTVKSLKSAVEAGQNMDKVSKCSYMASASQLNSVAKKNTTLASAMKKQASTITAAAKAVTESQTKKAVDDAKKKLSAEVSTARTLLDQSAGAVTDDTTRTSLQDAINAANTALNKNGVTADELAKVLTALQNAEKSVQTSMQEYQAQQAAAQNDGSGNSGYYGYGNSGAGNGNTGNGNGSSGSGAGNSSGSGNGSGSNPGNSGNGNGGDNGNGGGTTPNPNPGTGGDNGGNGGDNGNTGGDNGNNGNTGGDNGNGNTGGDNGGNGNNGNNGGDNGNGANSGN